MACLKNLRGRLAPGNETLLNVKKRILIVNCYFDDLRGPVRRKLKIPQAMGPVFLAGAFCPDLCDIKLYNEQFSGPLEDEHLLAFPDLLVLTGLNTAFDRMLHITAYARTKNPDVIVVAGGPAIRALTQYSARFFDYCCTGDIEQIKDVITDALGPAHVSPELREKGWPVPRYDLAYWMKIGGYVESSRNCYYTCSFCSLTAEGKPYCQYDMAYLNRQFEALGRRRRILFIDNNFGGTSRRFLMDRFDYLERLKRRGYIDQWSAMVSSEFFFSEDNLRRAKASGCMAFFSGVESFDSGSLVNFQKVQNIRKSQIDLITRCLRAGIVFSYGLLLDISTRSVADLKREIDFILETPEIPLPSYLSIAVPMLGTPFFHEVVRHRRLLPNIKIRDLDSTTITIKPADALKRTAAFVRDLQQFRGFRRKAVRHLKAFYQLYKKNIAFENIPFLINGSLVLCLPHLSTAGPDIFRSKWINRKRTFIGSTEAVDRVYKPAFVVDRRFRHYFSPTMLTDAEGYLSNALVPDLMTDAATTRRADNTAAGNIASNPSSVYNT